MKKILLTIIIALSTIATQAQWTNQTVPLPFTGYINNIRAVDANTVWGNAYNATTTPAVATRNFVRTTNGGLNWSYALMTGTPINHRVSNMFPLDSSVCYSAMYNSAGAGGGVFKTVNGGTNWAKVGLNMFTLSTSFPDLVYFWDAQNGVVVGDPDGSGTTKYEIYTTSDSGATWIRVPATNIPALADPAEFGITNLYGAADGRIWFGTTYGDVYRSDDKGFNWTKSATGLPAYTGTTGRNDIANVTFCDSIHGIVEQVDSLTIILKSTSDGGLTWNPLTPNGPIFTDFSAVRNSPILVSCGSNAIGAGTSFSVDFGANWIYMGPATSHTSIDFPNDSVGYSGQFINLGTVGGAWKYSEKLQAVPCGSPLISAGITSLNAIDLCFGDTVTASSSGAVAPNDGSLHGFSILISNSDITGNTDPLNSGGVLIGSGNIPTAAQIVFVNNDSVNFPAGQYYFTTIVYGNAIDNSGTFGLGSVTGFILDTACTYSGTSILVNLLGPGAPGCSGVGINENHKNDFSISNLYPVPVKDVLNFTVNAKSASLLIVSVKDILGREVYTSSIAVNSGVNKVSIPTQGLSNAVYVISLLNGQSQAISKFVKE